MMRIAIYSDVHGNRHALDAVLADIQARRSTLCTAWVIWSATAPFRTR